MLLSSSKVYDNLKQLHGHRTKRLRIHKHLVKTHAHSFLLKLYSFWSNPRGQRPVCCFELRGPRTIVMVSMRLKHVSLYISLLFRGQVSRGQRPAVPRSRGHRRTSADNLLSFFFRRFFVWCHRIALLSCVHRCRLGLSRL